MARKTIVTEAYNANKLSTSLTPLVFPLVFQLSKSTISLLF